MLIKILVGFGLLFLGYYVGREIGRSEHIREELEASGKRKGITIEQNPEHLNH
jgi:hypothetical protein